MTLRYQAPPYIHDDDFTHGSYNGGFPLTYFAYGNALEKQIGPVFTAAVTKDLKYTATVDHTNGIIYLLDNNLIHQNRDIADNINPNVNPPVPPKNPPKWASATENVKCSSVIGSGDILEDFKKTPKHCHVKFLQYYENGNPKLFCVNTIKGLYFFNIASDFSDIGLISVYNHLNLNLQCTNAELTDDGNTLFASFGHYLAALDITNAETDNPVLLDQYENTTTQNIVGMGYDKTNSILAMSITNINGYADHIKFIYYGAATKKFTQDLRYEIKDKPNHDYRSLYINSPITADDLPVLYVTNTNSIDINGEDSMRSQVGLNVISFNSNYTSHVRMLVRQLGEYWNDNVIPLDKAKEPGFLAGQQIKQRYITVNPDGIMCVNFWKDLTPQYQNEYRDYSKERHSGFVMYDISTRTNVPTNIGTIYTPITPWAICSKDRPVSSLIAERNNWDQHCTPVFDTVLIHDDSILYNKHYLSMTAGPNLTVAPRVQMINYNISTSYQDIFTTDEAYETAMTGDGQYIFVAHGAAGIKAYSYDSTTQQYNTDSYYTFTFNNNKPVYTLAMSFRNTDGLNQANEPYQLFVGGENIYAIFDISNPIAPSLIYQDNNDIVFDTENGSPGTFRTQLLLSSGYNDLEYTVTSINPNETDPENTTINSQPVNVFTDVVEIKKYAVKVYRQQFDPNNPNTKAFALKLSTGDGGYVVRPELPIGSSASNTNRILIFDQSDISNEGHRLLFSTTKDGTHNTTPGFEYPIGVTKVGTPGNVGAYTKIKINKLLTPRLWYYCENHACMGYTCRGVSPT